MKESNTEEIANHSGPESCAGVCKDIGEALTGAHAGWAIEPRNQHFGVPTSLTEAEGNTAMGVSSEHIAGSARSKNLCMHGISMCENREIQRLPGRSHLVGQAAKGRLRL